MSGRIRPPAATAGFLLLSDRPRRGNDRLLVPEAGGLRPARRRRHWRWHRYLILCVAVYCAWLGHGEWTAYQRLSASAAGLHHQVVALQSEQSQLRSEIAYAQTDAYVAGAARQEFGLVSPDEVPLTPVAVPATGAARPGAGR